MNLKSSVKKYLPDFFKFLHSARMRAYCLIGRVSPRTLVSIWYRNLFGCEIDLDNPRTIDEKINWLKLYSDTSLWEKCADKVAVREYVSNAGLGNTLNELYGVFDNPDEIDFNAFPDKFVLKTNNGGGGRSILILDRSRGFDECAVRKTLKKWLRNKEGYQYYEPQYQTIRPRIIVERYLTPDKGESSIVDFKINCVNGKAHSVFLCSDRDPGKEVSYSVYDLDWNLRPDCITADHRTEKVYPRPASFDLMLEYSERLAAGIPFVRVDWYEIEGKPVFSEMTFTPGGGFECFYSEDFRLEMGNALVLPSRVTER